MPSRMCWPQNWNGAGWMSETTSVDLEPNPAPPGFDPVYNCNGQLISWTVNGRDLGDTSYEGTIAHASGLCPMPDKLAAMLWDQMLRPGDMWFNRRVTWALFAQCTGIYDERACAEIMDVGTAQLGWSRPRPAVDWFAPW